MKFVAAHWSEILNAAALIGALVGAALPESSKLGATLRRWFPDLGNKNANALPADALAKLAAEVGAAAKGVK